MVLDYAVRVRDHRGILDERGMAAPMSATLQFMPMTFSSARRRGAVISGLGRANACHRDRDVLRVRTLVVLGALGLSARPASARPASTGFFAEGGLGRSSFLPSAASDAAVGPGIELRVGRDLFSWLSLGFVSRGVDPRGDVPPPPAASGSSSTAAAPMRGSAAGSTRSRCSSRAGSARR